MFIFNSFSVGFSSLNTFSKLYERVIKDQLVLSMENYFSPMVIAYRKSYSKQHVITRLVEEWREQLDENFVVGAVLTDLSKAFNCIAHDRFRYHIKSSENLESFKMIIKHWNVTRCNCKVCNTP